MKKTELKNCPQWLLDANTENENVTLKNGVLQWWGGNFLGGNFRGGDFRGGNFRGGNFLGGNFRGGNFRGGNFWGGDFRGGNFLGGNFWGGDFRGGDFQGGDFWGGNFLGGDFRGGKVNGTDAKVVITFTNCDGYPKTLVNRDGVAWILAGCRWFTLADAKKHWAGKADRVFTRAALHAAVALAKHLGLREK